MAHNLTVSREWSFGGADNDF